MKTIDLKPRAIAVLCALRSGPKTMRQLHNAIGDQVSSETHSLMLDMMSLALVSVQDANPRPSRLWGLTHDGLGWLQSHGLDANPAAKQALYDATDAQLAAAGVFKCAGPRCPGLIWPASVMSHPISCVGDPTEVKP